VSKRDCGGVGTTSPEERHIVAGRHSLTAAHHRYFPIRQRIVDAVRVHFKDLGISMGGARQKPGLTAGERLAFYSKIAERHSDQRTGLPLATRDEHVHLSTWFGSTDFIGQAKQLIGFFAHGRDDQHHLIASALAAGDVIGYFTDSVRITDRSTAELLYDEGHNYEGYRRQPRGGSFAIQSATNQQPEFSVG